MWPSSPAVSARYSPIQSCEESQETLTLEKDTQALVQEQKHWNYVLRSKAFSISIALSASLITLLVAFTVLKAKYEIHDCGHSPAEAVAKKCHFDLLAFAWVPIPCFDAEYVHIFFRSTCY